MNSVDDIISKNITYELYPLHRWNEFVNKIVKCSSVKGYSWC